MRLRWVMIAVAAVAVILALEMRLFGYCRNLVSDLGDGVGYIPSEARMTWVAFQIPFLLIVVLIFSIRERRNG